ncbi:MAG: hypothetical protein ABMB14_40960 [Myxococcota bacterium]
MDPIDDLRTLGIDADHLALAALLPLVRVAWADGAIQPAERDRVLELARAHGLLDAAGATIVDGWLAEAPSGLFRATADRVVKQLVDRAALPAGLAPADLVTRCWELAGAAGGLLGTRVLAITGTERQALEEIAEVLGVHALER